MLKPTPEEIEIMIDLVHEVYKNIKFSDYKTIAKIIEEEFEVIIIEQDIYDYYEGVYKQEKEDNYLIIKNAGIEY